MKITNTKQSTFKVLLKIATGALLATGLISTAIAAPIPKKTYVDVMFLYSAGVEREAGGDAQTLIDHKVAVTNKIYADSGLDIVIRNVHSRKVSTSDEDNTNDVLSRMTDNQAEFTGVSEERKQHGADTVVMLRPYAGDGVCGLAWIGGYRSNGNMAWSRNSMYSHTSITSCGDYVMAHELGHNMGLNHSRRQAPEGGAYRYATGYGVDGQFVTVMAYFTAFGTRNKIYKFASPSLTCKGVPCGISQGDPQNGANAVAALRKTVPQVARYLPSNQSADNHDNGGNNTTRGMTKLFEYRDMKQVTPGGQPLDRFVQIPDGASQLVVTTSDGSGDCNLYAHNKGWPDAHHFTHKSTTAGNTNEKLIINNPGNLYTLSLFAEQASCKGVTMKAYYK